MRLLRLSLALAALASPSAFADAKADLGKKLLETSGLKAQVEQFPELVEDSLEQQREAARMPAEQFDAFAKIVRDRFAPASFYPALEAGFLKAIDEKSLQAVDRWYQSPFAKKLTELEKKASSPEAQAELARFAQSEEAAQPPAARLKLIQSLDEAVRGTESALELMVGITKGMIRGLVSATSGKPADGLTDEALQDMRAQVRPILQRSIQLSFLYTYRTLSDQELKEYVKFLSTPAARAFYRAIAKGYEAAFEDASARIGKDLAGTFSKKAKP